MATIKIPTPLRKFTQQASQVEVEADTVEDAVQELVKQYPGLQKHLLDEQGRIRSYVNIFVGDRNIRDLQQGQTAVATQQTISIVPAIAGGGGACSS